MSLHSVLNITESLKGKPLEQQIFSFVSILGFFLSIILLMVDFILFYPSFSLILDAIAIISLAVFWYAGQKNDSYKYLAVPLSYELLLLVTMGWITSRGSASSSNWSLYCLVISASIGMLQNDQRKLYLTIVYIVLFSLAAFDYFYASTEIYHLTIPPIETFFNFIYGLVVLSADVIIVAFIKNQYDNERNTIQQQVKLLDSASKELETQNEELVQQNEEIKSQRDIIEETNTRLTLQSNELNEVMDQIFKYNINLEEMVQQRTQEVSLLNKELDLFMYRSSHDFRGPMMTLRGLTQVATLLKTNDEHLNLWNKVETTIDKVDRMLNKFLMISEINYADDVEIRSLSDTVQIVAKKYALKLNGFNFDVGIGIRNYSVVDPRNKLISIIFENALENSLQYARYNSEKTISLNINEMKNNLIVTIKDNGIGIPKEMLPKVTDMYFRGNENSTGNGLGLYVAYLAAKKLNGSITVDSKLGEYTLVQVEFPIFSNPEIS